MALKTSMNCGPYFAHYVAWVGRRSGNCDWKSIGRCERRRNDHSPSDSRIRFWRQTIGEPIYNVMWNRVLISLSLVALCGCFKTKDELTVEADGSGVVRIETQTSIPPEMAGMVGAGRMRGGAGMMTYPPISEEEAQQWFPEKDFKVTTKERKDADGESVLTIEAKFIDVNALLASPYGRAQ